MSDAHSDEGKEHGTYAQFNRIFVKRCNLLPVYFLAAEFWAKYCAHTQLCTVYSGNRK
jgi:hypothetical protein